jgi:uncharacterized membrane protein
MTGLQIGMALAAGALIVAVIAVRMAIRRAIAEALAAERAKLEAIGLRQYHATTERMRDAEAAFGDDPAILRGQLHARDPNQR